MGTFRLIVAYDGAAFHGWQSQPGRRTVQGMLEEAVSAMLESGPVDVHGAGRTDAGVHARGQVASFTADTRLPARAFAPLLNRRLPADVRVVEAAAVPPGFHARHSAIARRYAYRVLLGPDVLFGRIAWFPGFRPDPAALDRATRELEGVHDCASFQASGSPSSTTRCQVTRARWRTWSEGLQLDVIADHFLYRMVRSIVGTALEASRAKDPAAAMRAVIARRDRRAAGRNAPPEGLCLEQVFYPAEAGA